MNKLAFAVVIIFFPVLASAGALDDLKGVLDSSIAAVTSDLQKMAIIWLASFATIQMVVTNYGLLKSGTDIEGVIGKLIGSLLWFCFCIYVVLNGAELLDRVSDDFFRIAGGISGASEFSAGAIISSGANSAGKVLATLNQASEIANMFLVAIISAVIALLVIATAAFIGFKVFLLQIETALMVMIAPLSFSLLGLNALKDQGIAPFKSLVSLLYRIILLAILVKSMSTISKYLDTFVGTINSGNISDQWGAIFSVAAVYVLIGFLVYKSDSIAASLSSGSTNLGTADVAGAAALGAAIGAAGASGSSAIAGGAAKGGGLMSDFMSRMGAGSIKNASQQGIGTVAKPDVTTPKSSLSPKGVGSSDGGGGDRAQKSGGEPPSPRTRPAAANAGAASGPGVLGMGSTGDPNLDAAVADAGARPSSMSQPTTQSWRDSDGISTGNNATPAGHELSTKTTQTAPGVTNSTEGGFDRSAGGAVPSTSMAQPADGKADTAAKSPSAVEPIVSGKLRPGPAPVSDVGRAASSQTSPPTNSPKEMPGSASDSSDQSFNSVRSDPPSSLGASAGISGANPNSSSDLQKEVARLADLQAKQAGNRKPTTFESLRAANREIAQEKATTQVSINPNAGD